MFRLKLYSDLDIETALTLRLLYKRPLIQTEGVLKSISGLMNAGLDVPDLFTCCLALNYKQDLKQTRSQSIKKL